MTKVLEKLISRSEAKNKDTIDSNDKLDTKATWTMAGATGLLAIVTSNVSTKIILEKETWVDVILLAIIAVSTLLIQILGIRVWRSINIERAGSSNWETISTSYFHLEESEALQKMLAEALQAERVNKAANAQKSRMLSQLIVALYLDIAFVVIALPIMAIY